MKIFKNKYSTDEQQGFTVVNMFKMMLVILVLASVVIPFLNHTVQNARIAAFVEQINTIDSAVIRFSQDTNLFPVHIATEKKPELKQLLQNSENYIIGWNGPYIKKELINLLSAGDYIGAQVTKNAHYQFDFDGDGKPDTNGVSVIRIDQVSDLEAQKISDLIDGDGHITSGNKAWNKAGKVKRLGVDGNHVHILLVFISTL